MTFICPVSNNHMTTFKIILPGRKTSWNQSNFLFTSRELNKNELNSNAIEWTAKNEERFMVLHKIHGNLWALLSRKLNGFGSSFLKNHFYGRLRKSVRKLNVKIISNFSKAYAPFNLNIIFKLSNISEGKI
jgi:hypothetical protein